MRFALQVIWKRGRAPETAWACQPRPGDEEGARVLDCFARLNFGLLKAPPGQARTGGCSWKGRGSLARGPSGLGTTKGQVCMAGTGEPPEAAGHKNGPVAA